MKNTNKEDIIKLKRLIEYAKYYIYDNEYDKHIKNVKKLIHKLEKKVGEND